MVGRRTLLGVGASAAVALGATALTPSPGPAHAARRSMVTRDTGAVVVLPVTPSPPEATAGDELANYLARRTGATVTRAVEPFTVQPNQRVFFVGRTAYAAAAGVDVASMGEEQWRIRTSGNTVVLAGGGSRGTLYATYRFLEDVAGIRWWNPFEDHVPAAAPLALITGDLSGRPTLTYRDLYVSYGGDDGRFVARNRINRDGDSTVGAAYGGSETYGPPYHVHTFFRILPPSVYFERFPEWYVGGEDTPLPTASNGQLRVSNMVMRWQYLAVLRNHIDTANAAAAEAGVPAPTVYSVSTEDNAHTLIGDSADAAFVAGHGGVESALLLDFVNWIADRIAESHPGVRIDTLAYWQTVDPPTGMVTSPNVVIRLAKARTNVLYPLTDPRNAYFRELIQKWSVLAPGRLRVWDYGLAYRVPAAPLPTLQTYGPDIAFLANNGVHGIFNEFEGQLTTDQRDLKVWVWAKLVEDPTRDANALADEFIVKYYGAAAPRIKQYHAMVRAAALEAAPDFSSFWMGIDRYTFLTLPFIVEAQQVLDRAEELVAGNSALLRRVHRVRLSLDDSLMRLFPRLVREWVAAGRSVAAFPFDRQTITDRRYSAVSEQIGVWIASEHQLGQRVVAAQESERWTRGPVYAPPPAHFADVASEDITIFDAATTRNYGNIAKVIADPAAESGSSTRYVIGAGEPRLPFGAGVYQVDTRDFVIEGAVTSDDIPDGDYHWYRIGKVKLINDLAYLWVGNHWNIQIDLDNVFDPERPDREYEVWLRLKFAGPSFPSGGSATDDTVHLERAVLKGL